MATYHEHILKKAKTGKDFAISLITPFAFAFCAYALSIIIANFLSIFAFLIPAIWVGAVYASYKMVASRNVEFEYLLVESDLDIDKIINKSRRKRLVSVYRKDIIAMAPMGSKNLPDDWQTMTKVDASSHLQGEDAYVLVVNQNSEKKAIIFCPTDEMIEVMAVKNPRKVFKD